MCLGQIVRMDREKNLQLLLTRFIMLPNALFVRTHIINSQKTLGCLEQLVDLFLEDTDSYGICWTSFFLLTTREPKAKSNALVKVTSDLHIAKFKG